ncbi:MAG: hypothetical protein AB8H86_00140 [Polyangiales bacterium]
MRGRQSSIWLRAALGASLIVACGGSSAIVTMTTPARLPLKTIPNIYLMAEDHEVEALVPFLGEALESDGVHVEFVSPADIEARRREGSVPLASAVVLLRLQYSSATATRARDRNETVCGTRGCVTRPRTVFVQVPILSALLVVEVREGPSDRTLQEVLFQAESDAGVVDVLQRDSVLRQLREQLLETLDPQRRSLRIRLQPVELAGAELALQALRAGEWTRGRRALEALASDAEALPEEERAAFYYNLGVARRFDPRTLVSNENEHFDAAETALRMAIRLSPQPLYARALEDVQRHRRERALLAAQREAAGENFREDEAAPLSPAPPDAYRQETP